MTRTPSCPRCGAQVLPPSPYDSAWRCATHGPVAPLHEHPHVSPEVVDHVRDRAGVPVWLPRPMPHGWTVTGLTWAGSERADRPRPGCAVAVALAGPAPLGGPADLVLVSEEPGTGLGAGYAGLSAFDPQELLGGPPQATLRAGGHSTALWLVAAPVLSADRCVYVGEAAGVWLWAVLWPAAAGHLLLEEVILTDLRDGVPTDLVPGAPSRHLRPEGGSERYGTPDL